MNLNSENTMRMIGNVYLKTARGTYMTINFKKKYKIPSEVASIKQKEQWIIKNIFSDEFMDISFLSKRLAYLLYLRDTDYESYLHMLLEKNMLYSKQEILQDAYEQYKNLIEGVNNARE